MRRGRWSPVLDRENDARVAGAETRWVLGRRSRVRPSAVHISRERLPEKRVPIQDGTAVAANVPIGAAYWSRRNLDHLAAEKGADSRWHGGCQSSSRYPRRARGAVVERARAGSLAASAPPFHTHRARRTIRDILFTLPCALRAGSHRCDRIGSFRRCFGHFPSPPMPAFVSCTSQFRPIISTSSSKLTATTICAAVSTVLPASRRVR